MPLVVVDRVAETTTTTGTGALALGGAINGFRNFNSSMNVGDTCYYTIEAVDNNNVPTGDWESGLATYSAVDTLTRTTVTDSSNLGNAVSFSAGNKRVYLDINAAAADLLAPQFPTFDPNDLDSVWTLAGGNLKASCTGAGWAFATHGKATGKWRVQFRIEGASTSLTVGLSGALPTRVTFMGGSGTESIGLNGVSTNGVLYNGTTQYTMTGNFASGDIVDMFVDVDAGKVWFAKNGTILSGDPVAGTGGTTIACRKAWYPACYASATGQGVTVNFGQQPWVYPTLGTGFRPWTATAPPVNKGRFRSFAFLVRSLGYFGFGWAEINLSITSNGTNILSGATCTGSVNWYNYPATTYQFSNSIDGNPATDLTMSPNNAASQNQTPAWVCYDMGSVATRNARYLTVQGRGSGGYLSAPTLFDLWYGDGTSSAGNFYKGRMGGTFSAFANTTPGQIQTIAA